MIQKELYETAEENIKSVIEALLDPVVSSKRYLLSKEIYTYERLLIAIFVVLQ